MEDPERPHAALLIGLLVEWAHGLGVPPWAREAVTHSLEGGTLHTLVTQALSEARERGRREGEHPTPVVHVDGSKENEPNPRESKDGYRPTLPTEPPVYDDPPTARRRSLTARRFPPPVE